MMEVPQFELFRERYRVREKISPKAKSIRLELRPRAHQEPEVVLIYPRWVPRSEAMAFLHSRESWILEKLDEQQQQAVQNPKPPPARWDGQDQIPLRGVMTPVQITPATLKHLALRIDSGQITLFCPPALRDQPKKLARALREELIHQARLDAKRYLDEEATRLGVRYSELRIHDPRTLWGSCNPGGVLCFSWRLVMAPPEVFRYVVVHELCHLVHANHSLRFWALVERQLPGYEPEKRWLRDHGNDLHHHLPVSRAADSE